MKRLVFLLLMAGISACATAPAPPAIDFAAGPCAVAPSAGAPGDWLIGRWVYPYNTFTIRRDGGALVYQWERAPGLQAEGWGEKAAASGAGSVTRLAGCAVELEGIYTASTSSATVGRGARYRLTLADPDTLRGEWIGAGRTWLAVSWRREPAAAR